MVFRNAEQANSAVMPADENEDASESAARLEAEARTAAQKARRELGDRVSDDPVGRQSFIAQRRNLPSSFRSSVGAPPCTHCLGKIDAPQLIRIEILGHRVVLDRRASPAIQTALLGQHLRYPLL